MLFLGFMFCFGAVIDEAQGHQQKDNYVTKTTDSRARLMIVCTWMLVGFLLTTSYKSVLRAKMMTIEYDQTIDTIDDMLTSELPAVMAVDTSMKFRLKTDPREKVQELAKKVEGYKLGKSEPEWVAKG